MPPSSGVLAYAQGWREQAALTMLETGDAPVEEIALAAGFATPVTLRHHFAKQLQTSPSAYRRAFQARRG